jgi:hypothetical protein
MVCMHAVVVNRPECSDFSEQERLAVRLGSAAGE